MFRKIAHALKRTWFSSEVIYFRVMLRAPLQPMIGQSFFQWVFLRSGYKRAKNKIR